MPPVGGIRRDLTHDLQMADLLPFLAVAAVVIVTPGPDTALTIRNALSGGRGTAASTALGIATGQAVWTIAASAGVAALIAASGPAFLALRVLGAAYLIWLGLHSLWLAWRGSPAETRVRGGPGRSFRQGLLSNLGNPKMAIFFTSLLPQFGSSFAALLAHGCLFATMTFLWLSAYGAVVAGVSGILLHPQVRRALDAATGVVLVALGLRLASEER
jgi:threonine/homoserine/homoserine lactone efflux protein